MARASKRDRRDYHNRRNSRSAKVRPGLDFSLSGLIFCSMMMFMGLAAMNSQANLLFAVFGLMIGLLLAAWSVSRWVLRGVKVERRLPADAAVGRPVRIEYEVTNAKRLWPTFGLTLAELDVGGPKTDFDRQPHAYLLHVPPRSTTRVVAEVLPLRRGRRRFTRYQLSTGFPFGFVRRAVLRRAEDSLLVMPARGAVEPKATLRFLSARSTGLNQRPREGGNDELFGAREYRPGDPPRTIHWRRSARSLALRTPDRPRGLPTVKQMTRVAPPRLVVMCDTFGGGPGAEKAIAVASSLVAAATAKGLSVGLVMFNGGRGFLEVRPGRGKRHRRDLLAALAMAPPNHAAGTNALLDRGLRLATGETTGLLVTAAADDPAPPPAADRRRTSGDLRRVGRGNLVVIRVNAPDLDRWVKFDDSLDWESMARSEQ